MPYNGFDVDKLHQIYTTLQQGGYEEDYDTFKGGFCGRDNYENRLQVYTLLHDNGADIGDSYEEFIDLMEYKPAGQQAQQPAAQRQQPQPQPAAQPKQQRKSKRQRGWSSPRQMAAAGYFANKAVEIRNDFNARKRRVRNVRKNSPITPEGRRNRRARRMQARMAGAPVNAGPVNSEFASTGIGSPQVADVKYDSSGKGRTVWALPDGTETEDTRIASMYEINARQDRLAHEFDKRMVENGWDPKDQAKRQEQAFLDAAETRDLPEEQQKELDDAMTQMGLDPNDKQHIRWAVLGDMDSIAEYRLGKAEGRLQELESRKGEEIDRGNSEGTWLERLGRNISRGNEYTHPTPQPPEGKTPLDRELEMATAEVAGLSRALNENRRLTRAADSRWYNNLWQGVYDAVRDPNNWSMGIWNASVNNTAANYANDKSASAQNLMTSYMVSKNLEAQTPNPGGVYQGSRFAGDMMSDPFVVGSFGIGHVVGKGITSGLGKATGKAVARKLEGKVAEDVALRYFTNTAAGRFATKYGARALEGGANFFTFETLGDMRQQFVDGGWYDDGFTDEKGVYHEPQFHEGFSVGHALKRGGHGFLTGTAMGLFGAGVGNVTERAMGKVASGAAKTGVKLAGTGVSVVGEGTIFAAPDIINFHTMDDKEFDAKYAEKFGYQGLSGEKRAEARAAARDSVSWDAWTESMAFVAGMKITGVANPGSMGQRVRLFKDVKYVLDGLRKDDRRDHRSFGERWRMMYEKRNVFGQHLTKEDLEEMRQAGYGDLLGLLSGDEVKRPKAKAGDKAVEPYVERAEAKEVGGAMGGSLDGYSEMQKFMEDGRVSEACRAKVYNILTGHLLPPSTITGYRTEEGEDGSVTVLALNAHGDVVTRTKCKNQKDAERETASLERQVELNTIDIGEKYAAEAVNLVLMDEVKEGVARKWNLPEEAVEGIYMRRMRGEELRGSEAEIASDVDAMAKGLEGKYKTLTPDAIREKVSEDYGIDVDEALRKTPDKRTEDEREAVREYGERLFRESERQRQAREMWEREKDKIREENREEFKRAWRMQMEGRLLFGRLKDSGSPEEQDAAADDVAAAVERMHAAEAAIEDAFEESPEEWMARIQEDAWGALSEPGLTEDQKAAVLEYINARSVLEGVMDASEEAVQDAARQEESRMERFVHRKKGVIEPATMKVDDERVYVIDGDVVMLPDGSGVDVRNSSESVVILGADGEYHFTSPDRILRVEGEQDAEAAKRAAAEAAAAEAAEAIRQMLERAGFDASHLIPREMPSRNGTFYMPGKRDGSGRVFTMPEGLPPRVRQRLVGWRRSGGVIPGNTRLGTMQDVVNGGIAGGLPAEGVMGRYTPGEEPVEPETAMSKIPYRDGEPDFTAVDAETGWEGLVEAMEGERNAREIAEQMAKDTAKDLEALENKRPKPVKPRLAGKKSPMAMREEQKRAEQANREAQEKYEAELEEARRKAAAWGAISRVPQQRDAELRRAAEEERRRKDAEAHDAAVARLEAEKRAREAAGERLPHTVGQNIKDKWAGAKKVYGRATEVVLPDGVHLTGRYVLTETGAVTPSHDVRNGFKPTEGFPEDEHGNTVNDRDYERDKDAQAFVHGISPVLDGRGFGVVVDGETGVVYSGNNRTMSREEAAENGTDGAYVEDLKTRREEFGFSDEDISGFEHPQVSIALDGQLPFTTETFARFNAPVTKAQGKSESSVKLGKTVDDNTYGLIVREISRFKTLGDFYGNETAVAGVLNLLKEAGVISENEMAGLRTGGRLSAQGRELVENVLIGKAFEGFPDAVKQTIEIDTLRRSVVSALGEISANMRLSESGYDLRGELVKAVDLVYRAKKALPEEYAEGRPVSSFGLQQGLFDDEFGDSSVRDAMVLSLSDVMNSGRDAELRRVLAIYNKEAADAAGGQMDWTTGGVNSKEDILGLIKEQLGNGNRKELEERARDAVSERQRRAEAEGIGGQGLRPGGSGAEQADAAAAGDGAGAVSTELDENGHPFILSKDGTTGPNGEPTVSGGKGNALPGDTQADGAESSEPYTITATTYTNKRGKTSDVHFVKFGRELTAGEMDAAYDYIDEPLEDGKKTKRGWYDRKQGGYMMRSEEAARGLGELIGGGEADSEGAVVAGVADVAEVNAAHQAVRDMLVAKGLMREGEGLDLIVNSSNDMEDGAAITGLQAKVVRKRMEQALGKDNPTYQDVHDAVTNTVSRAKVNVNGLSFLYEMLDKFNSGEVTAGEFMDVVESMFHLDKRGQAMPEHQAWVRRMAASGRGSSSGPEGADKPDKPSGSGGASVLERDDFKPAGKRRSGGKKPKGAVNRVDLEGLMGELSGTGEASLADHSEPVEPVKPADKPTGGFKVTEEMRQQEEELRKLLGIGDDEGDRGERFRDPDSMTPAEKRMVFRLGVDYAFNFLDNGITGFEDFAKAVTGRLGSKVKPFVKSWYEGAKRVPGYGGEGYTPSEEVDRFDIENFDRPGTDVFREAEMRAAEHKARKAAEQAEREMIEEKQKQIEKDEKQRETDTEAVAAKAAVVAGEAELTAKTGRGGRKRILREVGRVEDALEEVNDQLALLGYYEAEEVEKDFNEVMGYKRNAERKAVGDAVNLAKALVKDLGIDLKNVAGKTTASKSKKRTAVSANVAAAGGDVAICLPLGGGRELRVNIYLEPADKEQGEAHGRVPYQDDLYVRGVMCRVEKPDAEDSWERYGMDYNAGPDVTYGDLLKGVRRVAGSYLPKGRPVAEEGPAGGIFGEAERVAREAQEKRKTARKKAVQEAAGEITGGKGMKNGEKDVTLKPETAVGDLFAGLYDEGPKEENRDEKKTDVRPGTGSAGGEGGYEPEPHEPLGAGQRDETERADGRGVGGRDSGHPVPDEKRGGGLSEPPEGIPVAERPAEGERKNVRNNRAERGTDYAPKGEDARIKANIEAIELSQRLLESGETATAEQMAVLRKFSGWGGLGKAFNEGTYGNPTAERLRKLLGEEGYKAAVESRRSAYYTPAAVIDAMWDVARALGFRGGNVLEGSAGIGNILGLMPADMSDRSTIHAVEVDPTTGGILSLLYPDAKVDIQGFEKTRIPNGSVDLAITNVPFVTGLSVFDDTGDKDLSKKFHNIADFCIAKNIRKLREGGIGIFITSSGTMDDSKNLRVWITGEGNADVIGAFRMHNKTFGGTGATSDIIVVRKRVGGRKSPYAIDVTDVTSVRVADYDTGDTRTVKGREVPVVKKLGMIFNKYFAEHPENMAGEMLFNFERGETRFPTSRGLFPVQGKEQGAMLAEWAKGFAGMRERPAAGSPKGEDAATRINERLGEGVKEGSMLLNSRGELCMARMGEAVPLKVNKNKVKGHTKAECFKAYTAIKKALSDVLEYQSTHEGDEGLAPLLRELNRAFDSFTRTYGNLHRNTAISFLKNDVDFSSIQALETFSEKGDKSGNKVVTTGKADIFSRRVIDAEKEPHPKTVKDCILASLYKHGGIDLDYIGEALGMPAEKVKREIISGALGFENPASGAMEVSYKYLSGNVREKLRIAQDSNEDGKYDANIKALEGVMPMTIPAHLIEFTLGSSWIEPGLYEDYIFEKTGLRVKLTNAGGTWVMKEPYYTFNEKNRAMAVQSEMCDKTIMGHELIEAALTNRQITVSKTIKHPDGYETITDKAATMECTSRIDEIRSEFKDWARTKMQQDAEMSARIEETYNERFNNYVPMSIPDEFVPQHFGGQVSTLHGQPFALRPHQGRAVVRGTTEPILLAHEVGTGKTFTLITTAMEMRRLGTARKPMIVVQNATVGQFVESAKEIYPNAKVLTIEESDRTAEGRKNFYAKIKYNDWDMIVVPQSVFEKIPDSEEREMAYVKDVIEEKMRVLDAMRDADGEGSSMVVRQAQKELERQEERLAELSEAIQQKKRKRDEKREATARQNAEVRALEMLDRDVDDVENFDDMGIDAILVDEAHEYKHLGFATAMQRGVKGVDPSFSKKSQGVYLKAQAVMERNNGRNVVFATGTPISNTAAEIWTFMRYLMPAERMKEYGIYYFDDFVRNFGNISQMVEFTTSGKFKENNRFSGYVNLPELVRIWSSVADTVLTRDAGGVSDKIPDMEGGKPMDIYLPQTRALRGVMKFVKSELDRFENMSGKEKKENSHIPLTMYGIAKAAAVDVRLVVDNAEDDPNSKTNATVRETLRSLEDSKAYKGTVAIFADVYQNKRSGFNLYEDIKKKLVEAGVPEEQIVVMKPGMTVKKKLDIFDKVNAGEVRVIMGSTFTLGTGVNIQERLHTLIHVDAPNRPMDYTQRNGRALRQGNLLKDMGIPVRIIRFGVEDSLDVTAYQRLKTKGAIADSIMNGSKLMQNSMEDRVMEEDEDTFGDMTAQLSGSEYAVLKNQAEREVRKLTAKRKGHDMDQIYIHDQLPKVEGYIKGAQWRIERETANLATIEKHFPDGKVKGITVDGVTFGSLGEMEDFFKEQNAKMSGMADAVREGAEEQTGKLTVDVDGMKFVITTKVSRDVDSSGQGTLTFEPVRKVTYSCAALGIKDENIKGNRVKNVMQKIVGDIATGKDSRALLSRGQQQLEHYTAEREQLKQREGREWPYEQQLKEAKERLAQYEEAMKKELAEKEAKYAEMDKTVEAARDVALSDEEDADEGGNDGAKTRYRLVEDGETLRELDGGPLKKGYRYVQWAEGGIRPPMTAKVDGKWRAPMLLNRWEQSEEGMQGAGGKVNLVQGNGRTTGGVAYNPYFHIRTNPLNDQFTAAYDRPELMVVEGYYPESEEHSGYRAEGAKDSVGLMDWHSGSVNGQLSGDTKVKTMLSRYFKPTRIVPWSEVADMIVERIAGQDITFPLNVVPPMLRAELARRGVKFEGISGSVSAEDRLKLEAIGEEIERGNYDAGLERAKEYQAAYETSEDGMRMRAEELSQRLNTPIHLVGSREDADKLPTRRKQRAKGYYEPGKGIVIVLPNHANVADVENTVLHEVVGHDGLRVLFPTEEKLNNALDELYGASEDRIREEIDARTQRMVDAEAERLFREKQDGHETVEDANANFYGDKAEAYTEANAKREEYRREATEEYGADLAGKIGEEGFEKMSREELTFWGKLKSKLQRALENLLRGLKIPKMRKWRDREWAYVLHKAYKAKKNGGKPDVFEAAEDAAMRARAGVDEPMEKSGLEAERADNSNTLFNEELSRFQNGEMAKNEILHLGVPEGIIRHFMPRLPIVMRQRILTKGSVKRHNVDVGALRDMPFKISKPIFIFKRSDNQLGVLTEMRSRDGKNVFVAIELNKTIQNGGDFLEVNDIRSIHDRNIADIVYPIIQNGTLRWVDKAKGLAYLSSASRYVQQEIDKRALNDATKLVENFENPKFEDEESEGAVRFRDGDMGLDEYVTKIKVEAAKASGDNLAARHDAMKAIGGNLNKLRQAMARQREYDVTTVRSVTDLARVFMDEGLLDDLSKMEMKRILGSVNRVVGRQDTAKEVQKVLDIMVDNQLRLSAKAFGSLLKVKGSKVNAAGVEVQGELDVRGQQMVQVLKKGIRMQPDEVQAQIDDALDRMGSDDAAVADAAGIELDGLLTAKWYIQEIKGSKTEEQALRDSIKEAKEEKDRGNMTEAAYRQYVAATEDAIRQNKIERAEQYAEIVERLGMKLGDSTERARAWRAAEKARVDEIHHNANSDMEGRVTDEHHKPTRTQKALNSDAARFLLAPLATFDQMLRMLGRKNVRGEGYLWNRFMRGWEDATEKEYLGYRQALEELDAKVKEIWGKKGMKWSSLFRLDRKLPTMRVKFMDGGEMKEHVLTQGNLLYIYMVDKMSDGRMKLRKMGITEDDIEAIKKKLDPKFMELGDWLQEEYLVGKRNKYNEVHRRMFGASMAAIENYFPLKILKNARTEEVDVATDTGDATATPATTTGSIIKRRRNNLALDITGANALTVILDHLQEMEKWSAFAEFNRDLNTLLSYKRFRNQVMNMTSAYGAGAQLWETFKDVCKMAAGSYRPPVSKLNKTAVNFAKGVTAAKVSFRIYTALKQLLSFPAYLSDANPVYLAANVANPIGAWRWCMRNLPLFHKRWFSRMAGDPRLLKTEMDWKMWRSRAVQIASRLGMSPNAFVDALTVAIGAHAMYQTKLAKYRRYGYTPEEAERRARQDATILFNQTQQSSESAFLSTMQVDKDWISTLFTVFRNSAMSYTRQEFDALRNMGHRLTPGYKRRTLEFMAKQMEREGIEAEQAAKNAKREYRNSWMRDLTRLAIFGFGLQLLWNLGSYLPYMIFGDDDEKKKEYWDDAANHAIYGSVEGLTGGDVMSNVLNTVSKGDTVTAWNATKEMPLSADLEKIWERFNKDHAWAWNDVINILVQSGLGVNPQSFEDAVVAVMEYCGDDAQTQRECALLICGILNCPPSQLDAIYFDEIELSARDASKLTPAQIAERYARYKTRKNTALTGWMQSDAERDKMMEKYRRRVNTLQKEAIGRATDARVSSRDMQRYMQEWKQIKAEADEIAKVKSEDEDRYYELRDQLEAKDSYDRYLVVNRYKKEVSALTKKWLRSKSVAERDSISREIVNLKRELDAELKSY